MMSAAETALPMLSGKPMPIVGIGTWQVLFLLYTYTYIYRACSLKINDID